RLCRAGAALERRAVSGRSRSFGIGDSVLELVSVTVNAESWLRSWTQSHSDRRQGFRDGSSLPARTWNGDRAWSRLRIGASDRSGWDEDSACSSRQPALAGSRAASGPGMKWKRHASPPRTMQERCSIWQPLEAESNARSKLHTCG